jgi:hypothetical protein
LIVLVERQPLDHGLVTEFSAHPVHNALGLSAALARLVD